MKIHTRAARGVSLACLAFGALAGTAYADRTDAMPARYWDFSRSHPGFESSGQPARMQVAQVPAPSGQAEGHLTLPLQAGTELVRGQRYWSQSGAHFLTLNPDGNLVVARADGGYVWGFDTQPNVDFTRVGRVVWQEDGNLAAYAADGSYIWSALTENPDPNARLVLEPGGALQIVAGNDVMWSSLTDTSSQVAVAGGSPPVLGQTNTGDLNLAWTPDAPGAESRAAVAFVSTDGTAAIGSRSVFILHNEATGKATLVPVLGNEADTRTLVRLAPGTYAVTPPPPSLGQATTFTASNVSATRITVPEAVANADEPVATVSFSVAAQRAPFILLVGDVTEASVDLNWAPAPGVDVAEYVLVMTEGQIPASNPGAGVPVPLAGPTQTSASVGGLQPASEYTLTLFATSVSGEALPTRSHTITTLDPNSNAAAYSVAPNTIVPTDFASLQAQRIGESWVRVTLNPAALERGSGSSMPGMDASVIESGGCAVGTPFLLTTDVAGDNSFFGVIDVCESSTQGVSRAIVNTDVPLASVFSYYRIASSTREICYDPTTSAELDPLACSDLMEGDESNPRDGAGQADIAELEPPEEAGTGEVQVTLLWATGDDLDVHVTDPTGASINWDAATSASGGQLDIDNRGGDCGVQQARAENVFWTDAAPHGTYTVDVRNYEACRTPAQVQAEVQAKVQAKVQVRVGGRLIVDRIVTVGVDAPITFDVRDRGALLPGTPRSGNEVPRVRVGALGLSDVERTRTGVVDDATYSGDWPAALPRISRAQSPRAVLVAQLGGIRKWAKKSCETTGSARFNLNPNFGPHFTPGLKLSGGTLTWDIEAGVKAGINPDVKFEGQFGCSLDIKGIVVQVSKSPIPVNLELKPDIGAAASASISVQGPKLSLTLGIKSKGSASAEVETCWWVPCGIDIDIRHKTSPLTRFEHKGGSATIRGKLEFAAGVQANLGVGVKNTFVTAKAGFSLRMYPLAAELTAALGTSNCVAAAIGAKLGVDVLVEAYILALGDELRYNLYESDVIKYPGASFEFGSCPDD